MYNCSHCGTALTAPPSHCCSGGDTITGGERGFSVPLLVAIAGFAVAAIYFIGRALIG